MKKSLLYLCTLLLLILGCSKNINKPSFIDFKVDKDSIYIISKNKFYCPLYVKAINRKSKTEVFRQLEAKEEAIILSYSNTEVDSNSILKKYKFLGYYGRYPFQSYDTNHAYELPFQKGYKSSIIQGYDGDFSHNGSFSAKTLDFDMKVGDTIVASRDGIVVKVSVEHNKQGVTEDFKDYGNYIMIYHQDNTFSQYVHLKQNGNLVKVGDLVKVNQPIAVSGFTGWTTIPHLHFGVYKPTDKGLASIPIFIDTLEAKNLKRGDILIKH